MIHYAAISLLIMVALTSSAVPLEAIRVNCGGPAYAAASGARFEADAPFNEDRGWGYVEGHASTARVGVAISGTQDPGLFLTERWGVEAYRFKMKPGVYRVTLLFAEVHFKEPGRRVFDVLVNGRVAAKGLDIVNRAGAGNALSISALVKSDGLIELTTRDVEDRCKFSALAIEPAQADASPPSAPTNLKKYERDGVVGLEWDAVSDEDVDGYVIFRDGERTSRNPVPYPWFVDKELKNGQAYRYRISAVDFFGNVGGTSDILVATPRALNEDDLRVGLNVGGNACIDDRWRLFASDRAYNPANGAGYVVSGAARVIDAGQPMWSAREGRLLYRMDLPPGIYHVTLGFFDPHGGVDRAFDIYLNNFRVPGPEYRSYPVELTQITRADADGLRIDLQRRRGTPLLSYIYVEPAKKDDHPPARPAIARVDARDGIVHLAWTSVPDGDAVGYRVSRSNAGRNKFEVISTNLVGVTSFTDRFASSGPTYRYRVAAVDASGHIGPSSDPVTAAPHVPGDDELLDWISRAAFAYYVNECDPKTFLTRDHSLSDVVSVAAAGFGLSALCIGSECNWIARDEAEHRAFTMLRVLNGHDDNKALGLFFHYLDGDGGRSSDGYEDAVSTIDSALLMWGGLAAGEYFGGRVKIEAEKMMERMNWRAFANKSRKLIAMSYEPDRHQFGGLWDFYTDEAILIALMGISAPREEYRLEPDYFYAFKRERQSYAGIPNIIHTWPGALFTYTFAHCWLDFRALGPDARGVDWFENTTKAVRANRAYCIEKSGTFKTFGENAWGLTASSGPERYTVAGAPPCVGPPNPAGGTLAPYGAGMSVPFLPGEAVAALRNYFSMCDTAGRKLLWRDEFDGGYGLIDSYSLDQNFFSKEIQAIDQGPMLLLIDNYRGGLIWRTVMKNEHIRGGLKRAGFRPSSN